MKKALIIITKLANEKKRESGTLNRCKVPKGQLVIFPSTEESDMKIVVCDGTRYKNFTGVMARPFCVELSQCLSKVQEAVIFYHSSVGAHLVSKEIYGIEDGLFTNWLKKAGIGYTLRGSYESEPNFKKWSEGGGEKNIIVGNYINCISWLYSSDKFGTNVALKFAVRGFEVFHEINQKMDVQTATVRKRSDAFVDKLINRFPNGPIDLIPSLDISYLPEGNDSRERTISGFWHIVSGRLRALCIDIQTFVALEQFRVAIAQDWKDQIKGSPSSKSLLAQLLNDIEKLNRCFNEKKINSNMIDRLKIIINEIEEKMDPKAVAFVKSIADYPHDITLIMREISSAINEYETKAISDK